MLLAKYFAPVNSEMNERCRGNEAGLVSVALISEIVCFFEIIK
jgi:hypothetical protein